ncbi:TorF family putative porin [Thalassotalea atypica]|uniref:TorF family putative porin n=1 Tax=Thalassotalea atypica TaxID=2054316 RepID=UPI0025724359|nr:TorF family putative porin [Thalassotalea atypica]
MNKFKLLNMSSMVILSSLIAIPTSVYAVDGLYANVGFTNSYLWRGLEQTNGDSAISGGIDYESQSGFYVGTWVSNADWDKEMTYELDFYGGYTGVIKNLSYDVGFVHYAYPDSLNDVDFTEVNASVAYGAITFGYAVLANAEGVDFGDDSYISLDADFTVASGIGLSLHVGAGTDDFYAGESFVEYGASLSKNGFSFGVSNTDLDNDDVKFIISYVIDIDL